MYDDGVTLTRYGVSEEDVEVARHAFHDADRKVSLFDLLDAARTLGCGIFTQFFCAYLASQIKDLRCHLGEEAGKAKFAELCELTEEDLVLGAAEAKRVVAERAAAKT